MLGLFLRFLGHDCQLAPDAGSALAKAAEGRFEVLLTDVHMPDMDGWDLIRTLTTRGQLPALVISMSAGVAFEEALTSREVGCRSHLLKPFPVSALEAALAA